MKHFGRIPSENDENPNVISAIPICERIENNIDKVIDDWVSSKIKDNTEEVTVDISGEIFSIIYRELLDVSNHDSEWAKDESIDMNILCESLVHGFLETFDMFADKDLFRAALSKTIRKTVIWRLKYGVLRSFFMNEDIKQISNEYYRDDF